MEYMNKIREEVEKMLPEMKVSLEKIVKVNRTMTGLCIKKDTATSDYAPLIYIDDLCLLCKNGKLTVNDAAKEVVNQFMEASEQYAPNNSIKDSIMDWESIKNRIILMVVNTQLNEGLLQERVGQKMDIGLSILYNILLSDDASQTIPVTNMLLQEWNVDITTLHNIALENCKKLLPGRITSLSNKFNEMSNMQIPSMDGEPLVLSNPYGLNGAATILYSPELLNLLNDNYGTLYILPSSRHEVLILSGEQSVEDLRTMVREVNNDSVSLDDFLSDDVLAYSKERGLYIA